MIAIIAYGMGNLRSVQKAFEQVGADARIVRTAEDLKAAKKMRLDYNVDRDIYDKFVKACSHKGFAPNVIIERFMGKYIETGQI